MKLSEIMRHNVAAITDTAVTTRRQQLGIVSPEFPGRSTQPPLTPFFLDNAI